MLSMTPHPFEVLEVNMIRDQCSSVLRLIGSRLRARGREADADLSARIASTLADRTIVVEDFCDRSFELSREALGVLDESSLNSISSFLADRLRLLRVPARGMPSAGLEAAEKALRLLDLVYAKLIDDISVTNGANRLIAQVWTSTWRFVAITSLPILSFIALMSLDHDINGKDEYTDRVNPWKQGSHPSSAATSKPAATAEIPDDGAASATDALPAPNRSPTLSATDNQTISSRKENSVSAIRSPKPETSASPEASPDESSSLSLSSAERSDPQFVTPWYRDAESRGFKTISRLALIALVAICGAWGAFISSVFRARELNKVAIATLSWYPAFVPLIGATFALLLLLLFTGKLIEGRLFPTAEENDWYTWIYLPHTLACLLIWSFIGGFSERLLPRVLKNLSTHLEQSVPGQKSD